MSRNQENLTFRTKRDVEAEKIRKNNRDQIFKKRRNLLPKDQPKNPFEAQTSKKQRLLVIDQRFRPQLEKQPYTMDVFPDLIAAFADPDVIRQHYGMIGVRKILSIADSPPIQAVIDAGLVPRMIQYVKQQQYPQLQLQATWALTNVASGTTIQCQSIIDKGGIPLFVQLLRSTNSGIVQQAIWAIGNISSDCIFYRDTIIRAGGLNNLVEVVDKTDQQPLVRYGCWAISNLCRGSPLPKYDFVKYAIPLLCRCMSTGKLQDKQISSDCCWAISYHSDANKNKIQAVIDSGVVPTIIKFLQEPNMAVLVPSIRILGNISTGSAEHTGELLKYDIFGPLEKALQHHKKVVRRQACWVISNIAAGNQMQVAKCLERQSLIKKVLQLFQIDGNDVKREICYIFSNFAHSGQPNFIFNVYKSTNIVRYYVNCLTAEDTKTVEVALECLYIVLALGDKYKENGGLNPLVVDLRSLSAVQILEKLQFHKSDLVYQNVSKILTTFFQIQDPLDL